MNCNVYNNSKKEAFTLAEILIALTVLGILAAMLIPAIMKLAPSKNKIMFRKAYSIAEKTIDSMITNDQLYPASQIGTDSTSPTAIVVQRGFNYTIAANGSTSYNKFCYLFFDQLNITSGGSTACPLVGATSSTAAAILATKTVTSDGITWYMYIPYNDASATSAYAASTAFALDSATYTTKIIVDVNGAAKPNCTVDSGSTYLPSDHTSCTTNTDPDTFILGVRYDGKIQVGSSVGTDSAAVNILSNPTNNTKY